jgi:acyl dehydratase
VRWTDGTTEILWAYQDFTLSLPPDAAVERLEGKVAAPVKHGGTLRARAQSVYRSNAKGFQAK